MALDYQKYIDLGFERIDINDAVEFKRTGSYGFLLHKKLTDKILVEVYFTELDKPNLYIRKRNSEKSHIIPITPECVMDLFAKDDSASSISFPYNFG